MFVDKLSGMPPFLGIGALGVVNVVAMRLWRHAHGRRARRGSFELLRDQHERSPLLPEERRMQLDVFERDCRERLEAQKKVNQLMREYLSLELERELQRLTEEQGLELEGRTHKQRERQRLDAELERERLARSGDQRNVQRLQRDLRERKQSLEELQQVLKAPKKDYS
jgi:hypothetical protein